MPKSKFNKKNKSDLHYKDIHLLNLKKNIWAWFRNYEPTLILYWGFSSFTDQQLYSLHTACILPTPSQMNQFHLHTHTVAPYSRDEEGDFILSQCTTPSAANWWSQQTPTLGCKSWSFTVQQRETYSTRAHTLFSPGDGVVWNFDQPPRMSIWNFLPQQHFIFCCCHFP